MILAYHFTCVYYDVVIFLLWLCLFT